MHTTLLHYPLHLLAATQGEPRLLLTHAISLTAALMCAVPYSSRGKNLMVTASETD